MKIKSLTIRGFRGFNVERTIEFHNKLTLIHGRNSYGKTSISEALEWLLYGVTSKVKQGEHSKTEYKGSYRNNHLPGGLTPLVKVAFVEADVHSEYVAELVEEDEVKKLVAGKEVTDWPLGLELSTLPKPFIVQHALKNLLLVSPDERFEGFAKLLGLEDLNRIHQDFINLSTKPEACFPPEVRLLNSEVGALEGRLAKHGSLSPIAKKLREGSASLPDAYNLVLAEGRKRVPEVTTDESVLPQLLRIREEAVSKVFAGRVGIDENTQADQKAIDSEHATIRMALSPAFIKSYTDLVALATAVYLLDRVKFFELGFAFLKVLPTTCPFCGQPVNAMVSKHISEQHDKLLSEKQGHDQLEAQREEAKRLLSQVAVQLESNYKRHVDKTAALLNNKSSLNQLAVLLVPKYAANFESVKKALSEIEDVNIKLKEAFNKARELLVQVQKSVGNSKQNVDLLKTLGEQILNYMDKERDFVQAVSKHIVAVNEAGQVVKHELDKKVGMEDVSLLIDLLEKRGQISKYFKVKQVCESVKGLRKIADQCVAIRMEKVIAQDLTSAVMDWYKQLKTTGDPNVHFEGFDLEHTRKGELKARKIRVKASSYGKELVSAVSSLSESKLNALGLCISIATNLRGESPFKFLVIDDPIQSWDDEHETQFIEVIRKLAEKDIQIILLSHNAHWLQRVRVGCRSLNGLYYEITSYSVDGPTIVEIPWDEWKRRLDLVDAILKDKEADNIRLQQAEEEIRLAVTEIASALCHKKLGRERGAHSLNKAEVIKILTECGVKPHLVDHIAETFETTDPAHHPSAPGYAPQKDRIRLYHGWVHELASELN